jgi:hypothetical protein
MKNSNKIVYQFRVYEIHWEILEHARSFKTILNILGSLKPLVDSALEICEKYKIHADKAYGV